MPAPKPKLCMTVALVAALALLGACDPSPTPSPEPSSQPAPKDPRKADSAAVVTPIEQFS
jgi:hypothetical protein